MFKCDNCGAEFEKPDIITEDTGEKWEVCPRCRGTDFSDAKLCELCGDWYLESQHDASCQGCINLIVDRFKGVLHGNFTPFEISILNSVYDGRNLE